MGTRERALEKPSRKDTHLGGSSQTRPQPETARRQEAGGAGPSGPRASGRPVTRAPLSSLLPPCPRQKAHEAGASDDSLVKNKIQTPTGNLRAGGAPRPWLSSNTGCMWVALCFPAEQAPPAGRLGGSRGTHLAGEQVSEELAVDLLMSTHCLRAARGLPVGLRAPPRTLTGASPFEPHPLPGGVAHVALQVGPDKAATFSQLGEDVSVVRVHSFNVWGSAMTRLAQW